MVSSVKIRLAAAILFLAPMAEASVRHINVSDGLSSRQVYEIAEDTDGFIWLYTNSGLDRFDGHNIKHYALEAHDDLSDHIQSATSIETDSDGNLWIAVKSGSIFRYNRRLDRFERIYKFSDPTIMLYNFTFVEPGKLVVCTSHGLFCCSEKGIEKIALDGKLVRAVVDDGAKGFYAGTDHGLYHIVPSGDAFRAYFISGSEDIYVLSLSRVGNKVIIGSFSNGISFLGADGKISPSSLSLPPLPVNAITRYAGDSVLVGVDGAGVYLIDSEKDLLLHHYHDGDDSEENLSGNTITDIHVGHDGGIWISTSHNGLNYLLPSSQRVNNIRPRPGNSNSICSDYVNVIFEDSDGDLWFGTEKGVSRYRPSDGKWWRYMQRSDFVASVVLSLGEDSQGHILVGTYGDGLNIIDKKTGNITRLPLQKPGANTGIGTDYVFAGFGMPNGDVWTGGINGTLTCFNIYDNTYRYYDEDCIATIVPDGGEPLFGGNRGVGRYQKHTDTFCWSQTFDTINITSPVRTLLADTISDILWIGTQGEGLVQFNRGKGTARRFTTADGLSSNTIYSLARDANASLWLCTETDLYRLDPADGKLIRFTSFLGIERGVFNAGGGMSTRQGDIMLGTANGCVAFNPTEELSQDISDRILFTDFKVHNIRVYPDDSDGPLRQNINQTDNLTLEHNQNSFDISFALINNAAPRRMNFEYILEGYDDAPRPAPANLTASYSNLSPGHYTLIIKASDLYSGDVVAQRHLAIDVKPPFWLSTWAIVFYLIILAGVVYFSGKYIRRARRERHFESQLQSYAAIAHDIRTPMSMIKAPLQNIEHEGGLSEAARNNLVQARSGVDKTIAMLDEMLGLRRETRGRRRLQVEPVDILKFLQIKIEEYATLALYKGIDVNCNVEPGLRELLIDPDKLDHIVDNLLSNALKYTHRGSISLSVYRSGRRRWTLAVADTGIGISKEDSRHVLRRRHRSDEAAHCDASGIGIGLLITRRLVTEHFGSIKFKSTPGEGSTFYVTLPLSYPARFRSLPAKPEAAIVDNDEDKAELAEDKSTIFVVDDDADMLQFLKNQLQGEFNVIVSPNSASAFDEIKEKNPDLVIMDVMMPHLRGDELCRMLKNDIDTSHIPVILLTGLAGREDIVTGLESGADDYVIKPFDIVVLMARIRNIQKRRQELGRKVLADEYEPAQEEFSNDIDRRFMEQTISAIKEHLADSEYSVNELCADLGMSRTSVYNKIKAITGQAPNEFMRIMRLNSARELLATHKYNISEVAYMVGFSDPKYFSTCFKKQFGTSPSKI